MSLLSTEERAQAESGNPFGWLKFYDATQTKAEIFDALLKAREYLHIYRRGT